MKKFLLSLFILSIFLSSNHCFADGDGHKIGGIRLGYHSAGLFLDGNQAWGTLGGMYVGLFRDHRIIPMIHLGTGIEYFQNGMKQDDNNLYQINTLAIPVHGKFKLGPFFALAGVSANFKLSEKYTENGTEQTISDEDKTPTFDLPLVVGAGFKFLFITIEGRYHWGTTEILSGYKNQYFQLGAGFSL